MGFPHYIYENEFTSENMQLSMNLAKKSQVQFSFLKVDSKNPKSKLEYLSTILEWRVRWRRGRRC